MDDNGRTVLLMDGNWKVNAKYGRHFLAESRQETMTATGLGAEV